MQSYFWCIRAPHIRWEEENHYYSHLTDWETRVEKQMQTYILNRYLSASSSFWTLAHVTFVMEDNKLVSPRNQPTYWTILSQHSYNGFRLRS